MAKNSIFILLFIFGINRLAFGQSVTLKTILDAAQSCTNNEQFNSYIKSYGFCFNKEYKGRMGIAYSYFKCGVKEIGEKNMRVNFAISNDGTLNSSLTTKNQKYLRHFKKELKSYLFKEIGLPPTEEPRENCTWYASENYKGLHMLWEYFLNEKKEKVWHIGFVWAQTP